MSRSFVVDSHIIYASAGCSCRVLSAVGLRQTDRILDALRRLFKRGLDEGPHQHYHSAHLRRALPTIFDVH
ncbi:hypothetical protein PCO82_12030 [Pectobacteriaceae bacterium CE90]|nr:hypothetical protein PCO82_12030 [Pectobacteriaceae bacterium CE90]